MALLNVKHRDPENAAMSVAFNRAGKAQRLRREGYTAIADRYTESLFHDVREWIATTVAGTNASDQTCQQLHRAVAQARGEAE